MARNTITEEQVAAAYLISSSVYRGESKRVEGINSLVVEHGINKTSAGDFINCCKYLLQGREFHRAMSVSAMDYFLTKISQDFGKEALLNSVNALDQHILYWEGHYKNKVHAMRAVEEKHRKYAMNGLSLERLQVNFEQRLKDSLKLNSKERQKRLKRVCSKPNIITVSSTVFQRNPDVVAERLHLAAGICKGCNQKAPFLRSKDGTPYLEVHHLQRLADGGLDTLDNTIALCPNCHRKEHYG